jgi:hypothetical protein
MSAVDMKIFGIGLNKTGTISLHEALETLGFRSLHHGGPDVRHAVERAFDEALPLLQYLDDHDAFSDIEFLSVNYALLDEQYPGSKFVLTTRDLPGWLQSRRRHVERNVARAAAGEYSGTFLTVDLDAWTQQWVTHHSRVSAYFTDRPNDLLVMNIVAGDGYPELCSFLGRPPPGEPFPWRHRSISDDQ